MKVLVANRGEIACRILRTLRAMDLPSVAVYTDPDRGAPHVELAREAVGLGPPERYLDIAAILGAAERTASSAIHPGYGFLSQNSAFVRACRKAGLTFIGPSPEAMDALGDKRSSRKTAEEAGVPVIPGARETDTLEAARQTAGRLGYPVLLKAAGGGGGKGMRLVAKEEALAEAHEAARREAQSAFGDDRLLLEKVISPARHIEVQILGDGKDAVALGERECSLQRRYQKVIEEAPALRISERTRSAILESAARLARAVGYQSAGTVEFLVDPGGSFFFLEVNTRLQVEHPVTEMLTGLDIVRAQIELAGGGRLPRIPAPKGHAIEARLYAEDPYHFFLPQTGRLHRLRWPSHAHLRIDTGLREGMSISSHYDPLLAKMIAWGRDRDEARGRLLGALGETALQGVRTNREFLIQILESEFFAKGETYTTTLESQTWAPAAGERLEAPPVELGEDAYSPWNGTSVGPLERGRPSAGHAPQTGPLASAREIRAPMTGKIVKIAAVAGANVKANDVLVVMEAMKMEYRLAAPRDGVVESILCKVGDLVDLGRTVAVLAP